MSEIIVQPFLAHHPVVEATRESNQPHCQAKPTVKRKTPSDNNPLQNLTSSKISPAKRLFDQI